MNDQINHPKDIIESKFSGVVTFLIPTLFFLVPVTFLPWPWIDHVVMVKWFIFAIVFVLAAIWFLVYTLKSRAIPYYKDKVIFGSLMIIGAILLSTIFSNSFYRSFFGNGLDSDTFLRIFFLMSAVLLTPVYLRHKDNIFYAYIALLAAFVVLAVFHILRLFFGAGFLSFDFFTRLEFNPLGDWRDLSIFWGVIALLSLINVEFLPLNKIFRWISYVSLILSLILLSVVYVGVVWDLLLIFSFIILIYIYSFTAKPDGDNESKENSTFINSISRFHPAIILVTVFSLVFVIFGNWISDKIADVLKISYLDARPSLSATIDIATRTLKKDPILGVGPGFFAEQWKQYKVPDTNIGIFWNTDFRIGSGYIPTFLVTGGILSALAWIIFLGSLLLLGIKALFFSVGNLVSKYLMVSSFLVSLFLVIVLVVFNPSFSIIMLTFLFVGLFLASCVESGLLKEVLFNFNVEKKLNFLSVFVISLVLVFCVFSGYFVSNKFMSSLYLNRGLYAAQAEGDIDKAEKYLLRSLSWSANDWSHRALADLQAVRIINLSQQIASKGKVSDDDSNILRTLLSRGLGEAQEAIKIDKYNYLNWLSLGNLYQTLVPLQISGAYEKTKEAYLEAAKLDPMNPSIPLFIARLENMKGDRKMAREYIAQSLSLKNNYLEAVFLLSQIEVADGNLKAAIDSMQAATFIAPNDDLSFFRLGYLQYLNKDYKSAASALERAIALNPFFDNAKYFLGLSYDLLGRSKEALKIFENLNELYPDNREVILIIKNIKAGRKANEGLSQMSQDAGQVDQLPIKSKKDK